MKPCQKEKLRLYVFLFPIKELCLCKKENKSYFISRCIFKNILKHVLGLNTQKLHNRGPIIPKTHRQLATYPIFIITWITPLDITQFFFLHFQVCLTFVSWLGSAGAMTLTLQCSMECYSSIWINGTRIKCLVSCFT